jgi:8-oxo-dGTP diphosphatase
MPDNKAFRYQLTALVLLEKGNKFLLIKESKEKCRNTWFLPGGRATPNESILQAAVREAKEETGMDVVLTGLLFIDQVFGSLPDGNRNRIRFVFLGKTVGGALKTIEDKHSICAGWFSEDEVSRLELRSPFVLDVLRIRRESPAVLPISMVHVFTREDFLRERP